MKLGNGPGRGSGLFIGRYFGIAFYLDSSWFLIAAFLTYSLADVYSTGTHHLRLVHYLLGAATAVLFFICILLHELGHSLVSQRCGIPVPRITLMLIGGVAEISREPDNARSELKIALGGPAVSLVLALLFGLLDWTLHHFRVEDGGVHVPIALGDESRARDL